MFNKFIESLISIKDVKYVYAHNLSGFDGVFLMKHLLNHKRRLNVAPIIQDGRIKCIKFTFLENNNKARSILFKDSLLMLPLSLSKLCSAFNLDIQKGNFPFLLSDLTYNGNLPEYKYWSKELTIEKYNELKLEYKDKTWNFKDEAINYCKLDCICLFDILTKFNELIFEHFSLNIHKTLTLPALAFKIFKTKYMPDNTIYQIKGKVEQDIREAYTGGAVDVYIPHNHTYEVTQSAPLDTDNRERSYLNEAIDTVTKVYHKLYYYDYNSLFPSVMAAFDMPVGKPVAFEGDIRKYDPEAFGFFYGLIITPNYIEHPILQRRVKTKEGVITIAGLGSWVGWVTSIEMDYAMKVGYKFQIVKGYKFQKMNIFKDYVHKLYELRNTFNKTHPLNLIAKLLMNSLYGRLGMAVTKFVTEIFDLSDRSQKLEADRIYTTIPESVKDVLKIDNYLIILRNTLPDILKKEDDLYDHFDYTDVNVAIAAWITATARVIMAQCKNNTLFKLFYSDTDSMVIDRPLPDDFIGSELGQLKLEHVIHKAVFLAPKVYALITEDGEEIIKIKGVKKEAIQRTGINFYNFENLLMDNNHYEINQEKFKRNLASGNVSLVETTYNLRVTSNKRTPLYNRSEYSGTAPINYDDLFKGEGV